MQITKTKDEQSLLNLLLLNLSYKPNTPPDYDIQHTLVDFFCWNIKFIRKIILYQKIIEMIDLTLSRIQLAQTESGWQAPVR